MNLKAALLCDIQGNGETTTIGVGTAEVTRIAGTETKGARRSS